LVNPANTAFSEAWLKEQAEAANRLGVRLLILNASSPTDIEGAFATLVEQQAVALLVGADTFFVGRRDELAAPCSAQHTPAPVSGAGFVSLLLSPLVTLRYCARVPIFWVLFGTFFVCGCSTNGLIQTHFVALCHDYGLAATAAASVLAMMGTRRHGLRLDLHWPSDRRRQRRAGRWHRAH
jgi:hypothetical protein